MKNKNLARVCNGSGIFNPSPGGAKKEGKMKEYKYRVDGRRRDAKVIRKLNTADLTEKEKNKIYDYAMNIYYNNNALSRRCINSFGKDDGGVYVIVERQYRLYSPHWEVSYTRWDRYKTEEEKVYIF